VTDATRIAVERRNREADILLSVTTRIAKLARGAAVVLVAGTVPVVLAGPASADVPEGWSDPEPVSALEILLVLVGLPLLLGLVIAAAVYVPALARGERVAPGAPPTEELWFGGPRGGVKELEAGSEQGETGGASGRW
jgi:hypothetical protein